MGQRGPKPMPKVVHIAQGNRSKKPAHELRDTISPEVEIPKCPAHLLPLAKKEWKRISPQLEKLGLVTGMDMAALSAYCQNYARWVGAETKLKELGDEGLVEVTKSGYRQMSVWLQVSNRALEQMHKFMSEFGMSPSSRSRVTASPQGDLFGDGPSSGESYF